MRVQSLCVCPANTNTALKEDTARRNIFDRVASGGYDTSKAEANTSTEARLQTGSRASDHCFVERTHVNRSTMFDPLVQRDGEDNVLQTTARE